MKKSLVLLITYLITVQVSFAQYFEENEVTIIYEKDSIHGTLLSPMSDEKLPLVILIAGSGATDRDGNQKTLTNNSLRFLAEALSKNNVVTFRYDKTVLNLIKKEDFKEEDLVFTKFIEDAKAVVSHFKSLKAYSKIYVAGHSQGSMVGMIAAKDQADGFVSLAGPGHSIDVVLREQLVKAVPNLEDSITTTLQKLKNGESDPDFNPMLSSVFRLSVQPFLIDWMQYDPMIEISKLNQPILIINGTKDIQISVEEAKALHKATPDSQLVIIENMNHIFKEIEGDIMENQLSYMNPELPVMDDLVQALLTFIYKNQISKE